MKKIKIPIWAIVASFIFGLGPLGVILIILKVISESNVANNLKQKYDYFKDISADSEHEQRKRKKREKKKYKTKKKGLFLSLFSICVSLAFITMLLVKHGDSKPIKKNSVLENFDIDD